MSREEIKETINDLVMLEDKLQNEMNKDFVSVRWFKDAKLKVSELSKTIDLETAKLEGYDQALQDVLEIIKMRKEELDVWFQDFTASQIDIERIEARIDELKGIQQLTSQTKPLIDGVALTCPDTVELKTVKQVDNADKEQEKSSRVGSRLTNEVSELSSHSPVSNSLTSQQNNSDGQTGSAVGSIPNQSEPIVDKEQEKRLEQEENPLRNKKLDDSTNLTPVSNLDKAKKLLKEIEDILQ